MELPEYASKIELEPVLITGYFNNLGIKLSQLCFMSLLLALIGCSFIGGGQIPSVTQAPTHVYYPGKFVWFDLLTDDPIKAKNFYGELFGWEFQSVQNSTYIIIKNRSKPIAGMVSLNVENARLDSGRWLASLSVKNVDQAAEFVRTHGGLIHETPQTLEFRGRMAIVSDPQDAQLVLLHSKTGDPIDKQTTEHNEWLWIELWTNDKQSAIRFYELLAGYTHESINDGVTGRYDVLKSGMIPRAGVAEISANSVEPVWLAYIRVKDPVAMTKRVRKLGGRVILEPTKKFENANIAIVADPDGAVFAMQKWSGR